MNGERRSRLFLTKVVILTAALTSMVSLSHAHFDVKGGPCNENRICPPNIKVQISSTENAPRVVSLPENSLANALVGILELHYPGAGTSGPVPCQTDNKEITLRKMGPGMVMVQLAGKLDRELEPQVNIEVECSPSEDSTMSTSASFTIDLRDANDNAPQFTNDPHAKVKLKENVPIGEFVTRVSATDKDEGINAEIVYFIPSDETVKTIKRAKEIESTLVGGILDVDYPRDLDGIQFPGDGFQLPGGDIPIDDYEDWLDEEMNETSGTQLPFRIDQVTGDIYTTALIDREATSSFLVPVAAEDKGLNPQLTLTSLRIEVIDVNDNSPVLLTTELHAMENQAPRYMVGQLQAMDSDAGRNAEVVFSKVSMADSEDYSDDLITDGPFIVKNNGRVLTTETLDRETTDRYLLVVAVRDKGKPRLTSTATVVIVVDDANDHSPVLKSRCLGGISVADEDSYVGDGYYEGSMAIDAMGADLGSTETQIATSNVFDVEEGRVTHFRNGNLRIEEIESTTDSMSMDGTSKSPPHKRRRSGEVIIDWASPEGRRPAFTVSASDEDIGENGKIYYSMSTVTSNEVDHLDTSHNHGNTNGYVVSNEGGSKDSVLGIDPTSGEVYVRRHLLASDPLIYLLNITVRDGGSPSLFTSCYLNVTFDVNVTMLTPPPSTTERETFNSTDTASSQLGPRCVLSSTSLFCALAVIKYVISSAVEYGIL